MFILRDSASHNSNILGSIFKLKVLERFSSDYFDLLKKKVHKLGYYQEENAKNEFALKKLAYTVPFLINRMHILLSLVIATT